MNIGSSGLKQLNPNSSIIKTHKSKYQGLIKQRTTKGINSPNGSDSGTKAAYNPSYSNSN